MPLDVVGSSIYQQVQLRTNNTSSSAQRVGVNGRNYANTDYIALIHAADTAGTNAAVYVGGATKHPNQIFFSTTNTYGSDGDIRMTIGGTGNVGIGTTAPSQPLHIATGSGSAFILQTNGTATTFLGPDSSNTGLFGTTTNHATRFITNDTERVRIDSSGRLLVGTSTGQCQLTVWDASASAGTARFFKNVASTQNLPALILDKYDNTNTTSQIFLQFTINNQGTAAGQINANGASQAAFGTYSDRRLKENIIDLGSQWQALKSLRPVEFTYINSEGGGHQIGFIAQEVQDVFPDLVSERPDRMLTLSGMGKNEARLIKALQEAMERIETLEAKVAALEAS
jgi:hypothetical protein